VLQCIAVYSSVLHCIALYCSVLQCVAQNMVENWLKFMCVRVCECVDAYTHTHISTYAHKKKNVSIYVYDMRVYDTYVYIQICMYICI